METKDVVIVSACRTAIGKFLGEFKNISARELAIEVGKEAIKRAGIQPADVDEIVMGQVYGGMQGVHYRLVKYRCVLVCLRK